MVKLRRNRGEEEKNIMSMRDEFENRPPTRAEMRVMESEHRLWAIKEIKRLQSENEALKAANRDLQDWFDDARATAEQAQARVAEAKERYQELLAEKGIIARKSYRSLILRKQAEAVEPAIRVALRNLGNVDLCEEDIDQFAYDYAQRLRQQSDELENLK